MKFLVFNLAVAAALVYLFTADRGEVQQVAGRLHDAAGEAKAIAERTVDQGRRLLDATRTTGEPKVEQPAPPPPTPEPSISVRAAAPPAPVAPPVSEQKSAAATETAVRPALPPAVARRRAEILAGVDASPADPEMAPDKAPMTAEERRRALTRLSEEMELLYARQVSR